MQVGDLDAQITRAAVSLDRSLGAISFARESGCQLLLAHHPLIFSPLATVDTRSHTGRSVLELARNGIAFIAAHTNWDSAVGGVNDRLVELLGIHGARAFGEAAQVETLKLVFFCPPNSVSGVIDAVSDAGAGVIGAYRRCAFQNEGTGTFYGEETANPVIGEKLRIEQVHEVRVEMTLRAVLRRKVERALLKVHPYETPAYDFLVSAAVPEQPAGRIGTLSTMNLNQLSNYVAEILDTRCEAWGDPAKPLTKVAVVGGAADGEWVAAQREGADVLITGEVKQHVAVEASESGMALIAAGHYATEHPGAAALKERIEASVPEVEWLLFTPPKGLHGRPL